jgi:hypothetical protein
MVEGFANNDLEWMCKGSERGLILCDVQEFRKKLNKKIKKITRTAYKVSKTRFQEGEFPNMKSVTHSTARFVYGIEWYSDCEK